MLLTIKKEVEETVEVKTPCWLHNKVTGRYVHVNLDGDLVKIGDGIIVAYEQSHHATKEEIKMALSGSELCSEKDFNSALRFQVSRIKQMTANKELA
jgi:16S rRNA U1498 N3-methylase RsmE